MALRSVAPACATSSQGATLGFQPARPCVRPCMGRRCSVQCFNNYSLARGVVRKGPAPRLRKVRAVQAVEEEQRHDVPAEAMHAATHKPVPSHQTVAKFYAALNARDWVALQALLASNCILQNMACDTPAIGAEAVVGFYTRLMTAGVAGGPKIIIEEITIGDPTRVGAVWHIEVEGVELPLTKGLSFFRLDASGTIAAVRENPEHFLKLGALAVGGLGAAAPLIRTLGPAALPAYWVNLLGSSNQQPAPSVPGSPWYSLPDASNASAASMASPDLRIKLAMHKGQVAGTSPTSSSSSATSSGDASTFTDGSLAGLSTLLPGGLREAVEGYLSKGSSPMPGRSRAASPRASRANSRLTSPVASSTSSPIGSKRGSPISSKAGSPTASRDGDAEGHAEEVVPSHSVVALAAAAPSTSSNGAAMPAEQVVNGAAMPAEQVVNGHQYVSVNGAANAAHTAAADAWTFTPELLDHAPVSSHAPLADLSTAAAAEAVSVLVAAPVTEQEHQVHTGVTAELVMVDTAPAHAAAAAAEAAAAVEVVEAPPTAPARVINLTGVWEKDLENSEADAYDKALDVWGITGMQKATAHLIEGLQLQHDGTKLSVNFLTIIPYFKVTEKFTVGATSKLKRRDMRSGDSTAVATAVPTGIVVKQQWGNPMAGTMEEQYLSPQEGVLHVISTISVGPKTATTLQVYKRRAGTDAQQLLKESEGRNGNHKEVLKRFGVKLW